jgi:hypothetical protein
MKSIDRLLGHTVLDDAEGRTHFLPWGLLSLMLPFARTYLLPDEASLRRVRRLLRIYLALQFGLVGLWVATSMLLPPGSELWWVLACVLPAPVFYMLGVARLARELPRSSVSSTFRDRLRLAAAHQHPAAGWLQLAICLGMVLLGIWVLGFDRTAVGILTGALLVLVGLLLGAWQLALLKTRVER